VDHQSFRVSTAKFYNAIVSAETTITMEPALSSYWSLRHKLEAIQCQSPTD